MNGYSDQVRGFLSGDFFGDSMSGEMRSSVQPYSGGGGMRLTDADLRGASGGNMRPTDADMAGGAHEYARQMQQAGILRPTDADMAGGAPEYARLMQQAGNMRPTDAEVAAFRPEYAKMLQQAGNMRPTDADMAATRPEYARLLQQAGISRPTDADMLRQGSGGLAGNPRPTDADMFARSAALRGGSPLSGGAEQGRAQGLLASQPSTYNAPDFVLGDTTYTQDDLMGMSNEDAFNLMNTHGEFFHDNKNNPEIHNSITNAQGRAMSTPAFVQKITDHVVDSKGGVQQFLNSARGLQFHNPEEFSKWESKNPEMALRYHARAKAGNGQVGGIEGYDHGARAQELAYQLSQEAGWGKDGKQDGKAYAYDFDQFNDVNSENGDGDFWKLGTPQTFTNDISDFIEDNPWETAAVAAALVGAPYLAPYIGAAGAGAVGGAVSGGAMASATDQNVLTGALKGGLTGAAGGYYSTLGDAAQTAEQVSTLNQLANSGKDLLGAGKDLYGAHLATRGTEVQSPYASRDAYLASKSQTPQSTWTNDYLKSRRPRRGLLDDNSGGGLV